jgi:drug/metabolite transporter (DMT)-like permease
VKFKERLRGSLWPGRLALTFVGVSLILAGIGTLQEQRLHYANYWGGSVFAPFAIALGVAVLIIVIVKWRSLNQSAPRLRGKAARRQQRDAAKRSAIETFDKPWNP